MFYDVSKFLKKLEKKCDLSPAFFFEVVFLYPSVKPKSNIKFEFLNAWRYSPINKGCSDANSLLSIVKSLSLSIAQK